MPAPAFPWASKVSFYSLASKGKARTLLSGQLFKPRGPGPFPAVILVHGCSGLTHWHISWAETVAAWGYVALLLDSFSSRRVTQLCSDPYRMRPYPMERAFDIYGAVRFLRRLPYVHKNAIAAIGFSHGGSSVLRAARIPIHKIRGNYLRAIVAYYPACTWRDRGLHTRTLILIGEKDDWTPARLCRKFVAKEPDKKMVQLKIYPGAYHSFDKYRKKPISYFGHKIAYHQEAAIDAALRTKRFLDRHLIDPLFNIAEAQILLRSLGYNPGRIDGYWGKNTRRALNALRRAYFLGPTSYLDDSSQELLRALVARSRRAAEPGSFRF